MIVESLELIEKNKTELIDQEANFIKNAKF